MGLHELKSPPGSRRNRRRRGQGDSAGQGSYAGRGFKGQKKRGSVRPHFEGGQLKLVKRLPYMRGFHNPFRVEYIGVNLDRLERFGAGAEISPESLIERGLVNRTGLPVKILGTGEAVQGIKVTAHAFSASARAKIEAAGGTVTLIAAPVSDAAPVKRKGHIDERARKAALTKAQAQEAPKQERQAPAPEPAPEGAAAPQPARGRKAKQ
ncbi:MAG: 50S ribosomal protein L15 [Chloroflexi bacterium]|nr:50S ribosomal protein L15 [Chloroflexota bacterium]